MYRFPLHRHCPIKFVGLSGKSLKNAIRQATWMYWTIIVAYFSFFLNLPLPVSQFCSATHKSPIQNCLFSSKSEKTPRSTQLYTSNKNLIIKKAFLKIPFFNFHFISPVLEMVGLVLCLTLYTQDIHMRP